LYSKLGPAKNEADMLTLQQRSCCHHYDGWHTTKKFLPTTAGLGGNEPICCCEHSWICAFAKRRKCQFTWPQNMLHFSCKVVKHTDMWI